MEASILKSTKKMLGLESDYTPFDSDILMFINSAFSSLNQLGVGVAGGIVVNNAEKTWAELTLTDPALSLVKIYIFLKVRMLFDPPTTSFLIEAVEKQIREHEWRLAAVHDVTAATTYVPRVVPVVESWPVW